MFLRSNSLHTNRFCKCVFINCATGSYVLCYADNMKATFQETVQKCVSESVTVNHSWPWRTLSVHNSILSQAICRFYREADRVRERRRRRKNVCTERCEDVKKMMRVESFVIKMGFRHLVMSSMGVRYSSSVLFVSLWWCTATDHAT